MATQANQDFLDYKHQRNILRRLVRKDLMRVMRGRCQNLSFCRRCKAI